MWDMKVVDVILVVFCENRFIVKTSRSIVCSEGLLLGTSMVKSNTEKWQYRPMGKPKVYYLFGWSNGCVRAS